MTFISDNPHCAGSILGLAIGDALGAPLEGSPPPGAWVTEMLPGGRHFRKRGEITDDTLQAIAVAESLVECRSFDPSDIIQRLFKGYRKKPEWYGPTTSAFFNLIRNGTLPHRAALLVHKRHHGSRSNGSVMRGFPIGIFYPVPEVYEVSMACSRLTHYDPVAAHCSAWLNVMVSALCRGASRATAYRYARTLCMNDEVHAVLGNYQHYDPEPSLDAVLCSHAALFSFMNTHSFEGALLSSINLGGDADTVGACCGALAGACWGQKAIPERWTHHLEGFETLKRLADDLWHARQR